MSGSSCGVKCLLDILYLQLPCGICHDCVTALRVDLASRKEQKAHDYSIKGKCQALPSPTTIPVREGLFPNTGQSLPQPESLSLQGEGFREIFLPWHLFMVAYSNKADER